MKSTTTDRTFECIYGVASLLFITGLFVDGWAHNHLRSALETFFTPWHALFYSGFGLTALTLITWTFVSRKKGHGFFDSIPMGYNWSLAGVMIFALGGMGDMAWHILLGVEADIEALLSPTHQVLGLGMLLMLSGGMRRQWILKRSQQNIIVALPFVLSLGFTFTLFLFMTQFFQYTELLATDDAPSETFFHQATSIAGILLFSYSLTGMLSLQLRHERLPFGAVTLVMAGAVTAISMMRFGTEYIPAALFAGLFGDLFLEFVPLRRATFRLFCFLLPMSYYLCVFLMLIATRGVWWSVHMWAGSIVYGGLAGLLVSFVAWPPYPSSHEED